jgi:copper ion binding protein
MENIFTINGMSCPHCKNAVEKAVKGLAGVADAVVDLEKANVTVTYDEGQVNVDQIKKTVQKAGYQPA